MLDTKHDYQIYESHDRARGAQENDHMSPRQKGIVENMMTSDTPLTQDEINAIKTRSEDILRLLAMLDASNATIAQLRQALGISIGEAAALETSLRKVTAERDYLKRREDDIIAATAPADGGQYRADIVGAIKRLRRERDNLQEELSRVTAELGQHC